MKITRDPKVHLESSNLLIRNPTLPNLGMEKKMETTIMGLFRVKLRDYPPIMENQMEKKMEN